MNWIAVQPDLLTSLAPFWLQLWLLIAFCCWLLHMRRAATACALLAVTPLLLPNFAPFRGEFKATLLQVVPWYVVGLVGVFFILMVLRSPIAGLFGAILGLIRFLQTKLLRLFRL